MRKYRILVLVVSFFLSYSWVISQPTISGGSTLCMGTTKLLSATQGYTTYLWNTGQTTSFIIISNPGTYSVTVTDQNGASDQASINVVEVPNPNPIIQGSNTICPEGSQILDAGNWSSYSWSDGRVSQTLSISNPGTYSVTVTDQNGCTGEASKTVQLQTVTPISITGDTEICEGESTTLSVVPITGSIQWSTGSMNLSINVNTGGNYSVTVTDNNNCQVTESVFVSSPDPSISCPGDIYITVQEPGVEAVANFNIAVLNSCGANIPILQVDTSGYESGDMFPLGSTPQSYKLDTEGVQQSTCTFTVNVVQRSDNVVIMESGDLYVKGIYKGAIYQSPDGTCWKLTINNLGEIKALKIDCPN